MYLLKTLVQCYTWLSGWTVAVVYPGPYRYAPGSDPGVPEKTELLLQVCFFQFFKK